MKSFSPRGWHNLVAAAQDPAWVRKVSGWALLLAFVLRAAWGGLVPVVPISDSNAYDVFAQNIAFGHGFCWEAGRLTAYWPVGTSAVYALLYTVFGHSYTAIVILNIALGVAIVALAMTLARRWLGPLPGVLTGWLLACWPLMIQYTTILASEMLFIFCVLLALWLAEMPSWKCLPRSVSAGIALAAAAYIRPTALLLVPLAFLREAVIERRPARAIVACALAGSVMFALILPWSLRNLQVFDHFVLISTNGGANFWMGNNPNTTGGYMPLPETGIANEAELDRHLSQQAWEYVRQAPLAFVARTFRKVVALHDRESIGIAWNETGLQQRFGPGGLLPLKIVSSSYWWLVLLCAGAGGVLLMRQRGLLDFLSLPPLTIWMYFTLVHSVTVSGDRYHVPADPFIAMLAAVAWAAWASKAAQRTGSVVLPARGNPL